MLNIQPLLKKKDVKRILNISDYALFNRLKNDPDFPKPIKTGSTRQSAVYFKPEEVQAYIDKKQQA